MRETRASYRYSGHIRTPALDGRQKRGNRPLTLTTDPALANARDGDHASPRRSPGPAVTRLQRIPLPPSPMWPRSDEARMSSTKRIEVFKPGVFTPMVGDPVAFSAADLSAIAQEYDHVKAPAPIVVGHPKTDSPAYGWARTFSWDDKAQRLFAEPEKLLPAFEDAVRAGSYKKISLALFRPDAPNNPKPGKWYPKHIGFLGGAAPAVPGLAPVEMAADDANVVSIEFGDGAFVDVASLFRGLRDWIIEKNGRDEAERVLPNWTIEWIEQAARRDDDDRGLSPAYSENPEMSKEQEAAFAEREAALKAREEISSPRSLSTGACLMNGLSPSSNSNLSFS